VVDCRISADLPGMSPNEPLFVGVEPRTSRETVESGRKVVVRSICEVTGETGVEGHGEWGTELKVAARIGRTKTGIAFFGEMENELGQALRARVIS